MGNGPSAPHRTAFLVLAAVIVIWGVLGLLDLPNRTYTGYLTDETSVVTRVTPGSPAEVAGLRTGDRILSIGGIRMEDTRGLLAQPRATIGEVRPHEVSRDGATLSLDIRYEALSPSEAALAYAALLIGLCFLGFGLWAYLAAPGPASTLLAWVGFCFSWSFLGGPYIVSATLRSFVGALVAVAVVLGFAVLLHYLLVFPSRRPFLERRHAMTMVYGPAMVVSVFFLWFLILQPEATGGVNLLFRLLIGLFVAGYFGVSLATLIRSYARADAQTRSASGLGLMLSGAVVSLGLLFLSAVVGLVSPRSNLPGSRYYFLALALIPITFAAATVRRARAAGA